MQKDILAMKAPKSYIIVPLCFMITGLLLGFSIIIFQDDYIFIKILCSLPLYALGVFGAYLTFRYVFYPKIMLYYDEKNIYLNYTKETIPLNSIKNVEAKCESTRFGETYNYGNLIIVTKEHTYKIAIIDKVEEVANIIECCKNKY